MKGKPFKLEGGREIEKALGELKPSLRKPASRRAMVKTLGPFDTSWREKVRRRTGTYAESGGVGTKLSARQRAQHKKQSDQEVFAGPGPLAQAIQEEFGNVRQAPQGDVRQAWAETKEDMPPALGRELWSEIEATARRAAKRAARRGG